MTERSGREALKGQMGKGQDLAPVIEAIEQEQFTPAYTGDELRALQKGDPKAKEAWEALKAERSAYTAIFMREVWKKYESLHASGMDRAAASIAYKTELADKTNVLTRANYELMSVAFGSIDDQYTKRVGPTFGTDPKMARLYARFKEIVDFEDRHGFIAHNEHYRATPGSFMERGFGTAAGIVWGLVALVPELAKQKGIVLTDTQILEIVETAYAPVIVTFMSMNEEVSDQLLQRMQQNVEMDGESYSHLRLEFFDLIPNSKGDYKLIVDHEKMFALTDAQGETILKKEPESDTYWCPVRYTKEGGVELIRRYFDSAMGDAKKYLFPSISTP